MADAVPFVTARDRDAWAPILGFLYQIELTVLRLIDLGEHDLLELERGEDIDIMAGVLAPDVKRGELERVLEQVKARSRNLTLNTSSARTAVANFHSHRVSNRPARVRFRFTTNAAVGVERPSPFGDGSAGIDVWEALRRGGLGADDRAVRLSGLRKLLVEGVRPEDCPAEVWNAFQRWVETTSDDDLLSLVSDFEWATLSAAPESLRQQIVERLQTRGFAATSTDADVQCDRLVVAVLRVLAKPGIKTLGRADLTGILADASTDASVASVIRRIGEIDRELIEIRGRIGSVQDQLSGLVPWAERARRLIDPSGDTSTFQHTASYFGPRLHAASTFNHSRPIAGRDAVLKKMLNTVQDALTTTQSVVLVIAGHAGVGKSRLLLESALILAQRGVSVRWVRDEGTVSPGSIVELPDGPAVLVCDDAHRRRDLQSVLAVGQQRTFPTVVVLGVRPWGRPALRVAALRANISFTALIDDGDLPDLDRPTLLGLVRDELGTEYGQYAEPLVNVTQDSALVALVGARLLRTRAIPPALLAQDTEFAYAVLGGFRDEILGRLGDGIDHELARRVLEHVAALGPLLVRDDNILENLAATLRKPSSELRRVIGALLDAGVLREDHGRIRIVPDVLADHILTDTLIAGGRSTGFEREVLEAMGTAILPEFVRNLAELQWQFSESGKRVDVFTGAWAALLELFRASNNWERTELIEKLTSVGVFQPVSVLELCEWAVENVDRLDEAASSIVDTWGTSWPAGRVLEKLPPLLRVVAQHEEYYDRAVDLLWRLGSKDKRATNQYSEHAVRVLEDVAAYSPRDHVWRKVKALEALKRWTTEPDWARYAHSPMGVARALLATTIIQNTWNEGDKSITMTRLSVSPSFGWDTREQLLALLGALTLSPDARGRMLALQELLRALEPPDQQFAHVVTEEEEERWRPQYEKAFEQIDRILAERHDALVRITIKDHLAWTARRTTLKWRAERAKAIRRHIGETAAMTAVRVVAQRFRDDPGRGGWQEREARAAAVTEQFAERLSQLAPEEVMRFLSDTANSIEDSGENANIAPLLVALARHRMDTAISIGTWVLASTPIADRTGHAHWLSTLLGQIREGDRASYHSLLSAAVAHQQPAFRHAATWPLKWSGKDENGWSPQETAAARVLLLDRDLRVRAQAVETLWFVSATIAGELVQTVNLQGDVALTAAVSELWVMRRSSGLPALNAEAAVKLLGQLVEVPKLDDHRGGSGDLLAALAGVAPIHVLDFLIERTRREASNRARYGDPGYVQYDAVPYHGWPEVWQALKDSPQYPAVVRRLRDSLADVRDELVDETIDLIRNVVWWDAELEAAFREWIEVGDGERLKAMAPFLQGISPTFVLEHRAFVEDLLAAGAHAGAEVERIVVTALREGGSRGLRPIEARPMGQLDAVDQRLATEAAAIAADAPVNSSARKLYQGIADDANERLSLDRRMGEDGP